MHSLCEPDRVLNVFRDDVLSQSSSQCQSERKGRRNLFQLSADRRPLTRLTGSWRSLVRRRIYRGLGIDQAFGRGLFGLVSRRDPKHLAHHTPWALLAEGVVIQFPKANISRFWI